ncbi:MAG: hypothetical protein ACREHD_04910 [Pirellulales bacterium]
MGAIDFKAWPTAELAALEFGEFGAMESKPDGRLEALLMPTFERYRERLQSAQQDQRWVESLARLTEVMDCGYTAAESDCPWSDARSPKEWAQLFKCSTDTFYRRRTANPPKIRCKVITTKNIKVHLDDLPKGG